MILLLPWVPILAAFLILFSPKENEKFAKILAFASTGFGLGAVLYFFFTFNPQIEGFQFIQDFEWLPALGIRYTAGLDGINLTLCLLLALVSFAGTFLACRPESKASGTLGGTGSSPLRSGKDRLNKFLVFYLVLTGALYGALTVTNIFLIYVFYELTLIPLYAAIGIWGGKNKNDSAMKTALFLGAGAILAFLGILLLYNETRLSTFDFAQIQQYLQARPLDTDFQKTAAGLLLVGLGLLTSMWPLHSWSPVGYAAAPAPFSMLHGGVKVGPYLILRLVVSLLPLGVIAWSQVLGVLAVITILYAGYAAMKQDDLKKMVGFSAVSHMGYVLLGVAALTEASLTAVVFLIFAHGLVTALSFAFTGVLEEKARTTGIKDFGGLGRQMPFLSISFILISLASLGLPGFASFAGEFLLFTGSWQIYPIFTGLAIFGLLITSIYLLRAVQSVCYGKANPRWAHLKDVQTWAEKFPFVLLLGALLIFGLWPQGLLNLIRPAIVLLIGEGVPS